MLEVVLQPNSKQMCKFCLFLWNVNLMRTESQMLEIEGAG